jgi:ATP-binding cassette subfamily B (MDR/TAP) protein 1
LILIFFGGIAAVANGLALPIFTVLFKDLINSGFNSISTGSAASADQVFGVSLKFLYLSFALFFCGTISSSFLLWSSARQGAAMRKQYLHCILRQEMAWFDSRCTSEIATSLERDCTMIQAATGEKL